MHKTGSCTFRLWGTTNFRDIQKYAPHKIIYILNFLGTTGHWKWNQWTPTSVTTDDVAATMNSVKSFLDHLASQMDPTVSQRCQIYQLEDVQIKPGETPDELVDHLRALADRCNFPTEEEKE